MAEWHVRRAGAPGALLERGVASTGPSDVVEGPGPGVAERSAPADGAIRPHRAPAPRPSSPRPWPSLRRARRVGWALIGLQLVIMVALSTVQYSRFALTTDFGAYAQAWWKIAHAQLDPWSTVFQAAFWKNDAELLMWPLALLFHLYPHPVLLLWVQDVVVAATEIVTLGWIVDVVSASGRDLTARRGTVIAIGAALSMAVNPWVFQTIGFDFHFETLSALFVVLVGRDLWAGRNRRLWWWAALCLASSVLGALYLFGIGLSGAVAGRRSRRTGLALAGLGLGTFVVLNALGAAGLGNRLIDSGYAYLAGGHHGHVDVLSIGVGALTHPGAVAHVVAQRWATLFQFLVVAGLVGVFSPWGGGMALVVFVPSLLDSNPAFLRTAQSFQSWPALPFVLVGSVMVVVRLSAWRGGRARRLWAVALVVVAIPLAVVLGRGLPQAGAWIAVSAPAAAQLSAAEARIPPGAEVIASQGVVGRFATRDDVYTFPFLYHRPGTSPTTFPVQRTTVVFVLTTQGTNEPSPAATAAAVRDVEHRLHGRVVVDRAGVTVLEWSPPRHTTSVTLDGAPGAGPAGHDESAR